MKGNNFHNDVWSMLSKIFQSYSMAKCNPVKRKYLHVHNGIPIFWAHPAVHMMAQQIFQRLPAK